MEEDIIKEYLKNVEEEPDWLTAKLNEPDWQAEFDSLLKNDLSTYELL